VNNRALDFRPASLTDVSAVSGPTYRHSQAPLAMPLNGPGHRIRLHPARDASHDSTGPAVGDRAHYETMFVSNLDVVDCAIHYICQRQKLFGAEAQEFESEVKLRLVEREYEVFRKFQHRSSLRTYLTIVIQRIYLDYRNHLWGKWRPSAEAQRLGHVAVRFEMLMARDGFSFDQACEHLRTNEHIVATDSELEAMVVRLPIRLRPAVVGEEALEAIADAASPPDDRLFCDERCDRARRISAALTSALRSLSDQDRVILRLRFQGGLSVADIARALHLEQKSLYRRFDALLRGLRAALETAGIDRAEACELVNRNDVDIRLALLGGAKRAVGTATASAQDR
jgi:RNA polymerase sigma factor (sigma-70 family)